jgi:hypothetical protein
MGGAERYRTFRFSAAYEKMGQVTKDGAEYLSR